jgi:hypothetical protein
MTFLRRWLAALVEGVSDPTARPLFASVGGLLATGTVFYSLVEGWSPLDAFYFSVTTLTTVGLGDLAPSTGIGKLFTTVYILSGVALLVAFANAILQRAAKAAAKRQPPGDVGETDGPT